MKMDNWIWLSHTLSETTPAYGGGRGLEITSDKQISRGDSCNTVQLTMPNHIGTHVDAPNHFVDQGKTVDQYTPQQWIFNKSLLIDVPITNTTVIDVDAIEAALGDSAVEDADLVLVRTGMEAYRNDARYWSQYPGFSPDLSKWFQQRFPSFSVIGTDTISISSTVHRDVGREAHQAFLSDGIRIIEDMALSYIIDAASLMKVIVMPMRCDGGDGAPVTVMGELE